MRRLVLAALAVLVAVPARAARITIYHTNDVHGWIMARPASWHEKDPTRLVGGFPAFASLVRKEKGPKLVFDAGDWFQGAPEGSLTRGQAAVDCMNAVGYDAVEAGNHDFDFGQARLKELVAGIKPPVLAANLYDEASGKRVPYARPAIVKEVAGAKIGIFGLLTSNMRNMTFAKNIAGLRFRREIDEAAEQVRELKARGATVIIAVTHVGFKQAEMSPFLDDKEIAAAVPGIDLIVGGHTHTRLKDGYRDPKNGTLIVQAGLYLSQAGVVTLDVDDKTHRLAGASARLVDLWIDEVGEAADVKAIVSRYQAEVGKALDVVIGTAAVSLRRDNSAESPLLDWVDDCARDWSGAEAFLLNSTGIRADMAAGPVTLREIFEISPFDNYVATLTLTGAHIREVLEYGVSGRQGIISASGLRFTYRPDADIGRRVAGVWIGGRPLDPAARYKIGTVDFLVQGGAGYTGFGAGTDVSVSESKIRDVLGACARRTSPIGLPESGRIVKE